MTTDAANSTATGQRLKALARPDSANAGFGVPQVDVLREPGVARQLTAGASTDSTALTTTCQRVSICAVDCAIRYMIGVGEQTATSASHYIAQDERLDLAVPLGSEIAVLRIGSTSGVLEVTELL